ncbi:hypothetical protein [Haliea sp.]
MLAGQKMAVALVATALAMVSTGAISQEADASLDTCRQLRDRIERLDARRKGGGSAQKMDQWKRQRQVYKDQFDALRCRHWGSQLR